MTITTPTPPRRSPISTQPEQVWTYNNLRHGKLRVLEFFSHYRRRLASPHSGCIHLSSWVKIVLTALCVLDVLNIDEFEAAAQPEYVTRLRDAPSTPWLLIGKRQRQWVISQFPGWLWYPSGSCRNQSLQGARRFIKLNFYAVAYQSVKEKVLGVDFVHRCIGFTSRRRLSGSKISMGMFVELSALQIATAFRCAIKGGDMFDSVARSHLVIREYPPTLAARLDAINRSEHTPWGQLAMEDPAVVSGIAP
ncbi:hypothetical protein DFH11DRAFT_1737926 [Phellopilus nigrolimitatus]|nr:hypothetical protein DFH11DRAFT_1737926 [Phellopilus nigrolimitatus]